jgi:hypothetical protein
MLLSMFVPAVEVISVNKDKVVMRSRRRLAPGTVRQVRTTLVDPDTNVRSVMLGVLVESTRQDPDGSFVSCGWLSSELPFEAALPEVKEPRRQAARVTCSCRVISPDLPDFCGLSIDMSLSGMQVEARGEVQLGKVLHIRLETTMSEWTAVELTARVAWTAYQGNRLHRIGLEYVGMTNESRARLEKLERFMTVRQTASIQTLILERADQLLLTQ